MSCSKTHGFCWEWLGWASSSAVLFSTNSVCHLWQPGRVSSHFQKGNVSCNTLEIVGTMIWHVSQWKPWDMTSGTFCLQRWTEFQKWTERLLSYLILAHGFQILLCIWDSVSHWCCNDGFILHQNLYSEDFITVIL